MFTTNLKEQEQIILAQTSKNEEVLNKLAKSNYVSVRRTVAKNSSLSAKALEQLCLDSSLNVTYIANKLCKNEKVRRDIISNSACVICTFDEKEYINTCNTCTKTINK